MALGNYKCTQKAQNMTTRRKSQIKLCQLNCQGLFCKFSDIEQLMLGQWKSDAVCFSETWLRPTSTTDSYLNVSDNVYFRRDRSSGLHGGLLVYSKPSLCPSRRTDIEAPDVEVLVLEFKISPYGRCLLICCYRSPAKSFLPTNFFDQLFSAGQHSSFHFVYHG